MSAMVELLLVTVFVPLIFSMIFYGLNRQYPFLQRGLPLLWLPSFAYLATISVWPIMPILLLSSLIFGLLLRSRLHMMIIVQTLLLIMAIVASAYPSLVQKTYTNYIYIELIVFSLVALIFFSKGSQNAKSMPALILMLSSAGLSLVVAINGSLLLAQLSAVIMSLLIVYAAKELINRLQKQSLSLFALAPLSQLYLLLLFIARQYNELAIVPTLFLLIAPVLALVIAWRYSFIFSLLGVIAAVASSYSAAGGSLY